MCVLSVTSAQFPHAELRPQCLLCQLVLPRRTRRANTCGHRTLLAAFFPILLFRQKPRAPAWFSNNRGQTRPRWTSCQAQARSPRSLLRDDAQQRRNYSAASHAWSVVKCWQLCRKTCEKLSGEKSWRKTGRCGLFSNLVHDVFCKMWSSGVHCNLGQQRALWRSRPLFCPLCLFGPLACLALVTQKYIFQGQRKYILQNEQMYILHRYAGSAHLHAWSVTNHFWKQGRIYTLPKQVYLLNIFKSEDISFCLFWKALLRVKGGAVISKNWAQANRCAS